MPTPDHQFQVSIRPFQPADQKSARTLILAGLCEHWGWLDESRNPDLEDIAQSYRDGIFLIAELRGEMVATGALLPRLPGIGEVVRMSVAAQYRGYGIGKRVLFSLISHAHQRGYQKVILETTRSWEEVISFYLRCGFRISHYQGDDVYFELDIV